MEVFRVEREKHSALEKPLRLLRDPLQAYSRVAGAKTPILMQAQTNDSVVDPGGV